MNNVTYVECTNLKGIKKQDSMEEQPDIKLKNDLTKPRKIRVKTARERFRERMSLPIGSSSVGIIPTKEMNEQIEYLKKYFNL